RAPGAGLHFHLGTASPVGCAAPLHDALPILVDAAEVGGLAGLEVALEQLEGGGGCAVEVDHGAVGLGGVGVLEVAPGGPLVEGRSEEHTSELQSRQNLVCRLLLEKKSTDEAP